jgi:hypothetical protein
LYPWETYNAVGVQSQKSWKATFKYRIMITRRIQKKNHTINKPTELFGKKIHRFMEEMIYFVGDNIFITGVFPQTWDKR